jgi:hypothetical protein
MSVDLRETERKSEREHDNRVKEQSESKRTSENEFRSSSQTFTYLCAATTRPSIYVKASKNIRSNGCF